MSTQDYRKNRKLVQNSVELCLLRAILNCTAQYTAVDICIDRLQSQ